MPKKIKIKLNGKSVFCEAGLTVMQVAAKEGVEIPSLCEHPDFPHKANCRVCVVEVVDRKGLVTSCSTLVQDGMVILTDTERVQKARKINLELLYGEHEQDCAKCVLRYNCKLLNYASKYKASFRAFNDRKINRPTYKFANAVEFNNSQCIDCRNCIDACSILQGINYLEIVGKGAEQEIRPTENENIECILCGQCAVHCPVSAAQEQADWDKVEKIISEKKQTGKIVVAQFAPSIRVSIGEEFGMKNGAVVTEQLAEAMKLLGFDYVFDVSFSADITTMVEAEELIERIKKSFPLEGEVSRSNRRDGGVLPMLTSCCPAWVRYVEFYRPDLIPNLTTSRSPQIHCGGVIKTYWAGLTKIDPKDIVVVSIMPCTAKKYEASLEKLKINNLNPVDRVLTTRELAFMIKKAGVDFKKLKGTPVDEPLGEHSGAGVIYGGSGGVMESALRTAQAKICGENSNLCKTRLDFMDTRGLEGIKTAEVDMGGKILKVAVVNGMNHLQEFIKDIDKYDYVEVMACPGGCIGGGGEPIPTNMEIRKKRTEALFAIDKGKTVREAHKNPSVKNVLYWLDQQGEKVKHSVLHTSYKKLKK